MLKLTCSSSLWIIMVATTIIMMSQQISAAPWLSYNQKDKYTRCLAPAKVKCNAKAAASHNMSGLSGFKECIDHEVKQCVTLLRSGRVDGSCVDKHTIYVHKRERVCWSTVTPEMCFWFSYDLPVKVCMS